MINHRTIPFPLPVLALVALTLSLVQIQPATVATATAAWQQETEPAVKQSTGEVAGNESSQALNRPTAQEPPNQKPSSQEIKILAWNVELNGGSDQPAIIPPEFSCMSVLSLAECLQVFATSLTETHA